MFSNFVRFASPEARKQLPENLKTLLSGGTPVKHNPVRDVFKKDGFFIKIDHRKFHTFTHEFSIALALQKAGFPVVEHLACGRCGRDNFLITRELENSVTAGEFLDSGNDKDDFITSFTALMQKWQDSKFFHNDPHFGNLLYVPEKNLPVLVDVHDIKQRLFSGKRRTDISRFIFNLRGKTSHATLLELWKKFHVTDPEEHFDRLLQLEIRRLKAEWKKRHDQLFSAYPKFSTRCGDWLVASSYKENFSGFPEETVSGAGTYFAASFFLTLFQIPHRRCIAVNCKNNSVRFEAELSGTPPETEAAHLLYQLRQCGFETENSDIRLRHNIAALNDISPIANALRSNFER